MTAITRGVEQYVQTGIALKSFARLDVSERRGRVGFCSLVWITAMRSCELETSGRNESTVVARHQARVRGTQD